MEVNFSIPSSIGRTRLFVVEIILLVLSVRREGFFAVPIPKLVGLSVADTLQAVLLNYIQVVTHHF